MNSVAYLPQSKRLLDQVREVLVYKHYSLKTEQAYLYWIRFFVPWLTELERPTRARRPKLSCYKKYSYISNTDGG